MKRKQSKFFIVKNLLQPHFYCILSCKYLGIQAEQIFAIVWKKGHFVGELLYMYQQKLNILFIYVIDEQLLIKSFIFKFQYCLRVRHGTLKRDE